MKTNNDGLKIVFWCSLLAYLAVVIFGIVNGIDGALHGSTFLFSKAYGMEAFRNEFLFTILAFIIKYPVIPACFIFQIYYLSTRHKDREWEFDDEKKHKKKR